MRSGEGPHFLVLASLCRAQLEPSAELAEPLYLDALEYHSRRAPPFERARTEFARGEDGADRRTCLTRADTETRASTRTAASLFLVSRACARTKIQRGVAACAPTPTSASHSSFRSAARLALLLGGALLNTSHATEIIEAVMRAFAA